MHLLSLLLLGGAVSQIVADVTSAPKDNARRKILFITNQEPGLANVMLAVAHATLVDHSDVDVHFASFHLLEKNVRKASESAMVQGLTTQAIQYENISGVAYGEALARPEWNIDRTINTPGIQGQSKFTKNLELFLMPWSGPEYVEIYHDVTEKIKRIDPDVIVLETTLGPAVDAARDLERKHIMLSANQLKDHFAQHQPYGQMLWKIPTINSAYAYPVPWHLIPANIYLTVRLIISSLWTPTLSEKRQYIKAQGLKDPANVLTSFRHDVPWISPSIPETEYPLILPDNVICTGPIFLERDSVDNSDPSLASWLKQRPTLFINMGSSVNYNESDAVEMVGALKPVLEQLDAQVLWKFNKRHSYSDDFLRPVAKFMETGHLILKSWIDVDIAAVLKSGNIALFVHHGGANSFYEALAAGVPTVVLPMWVDLYDYAIRTEWLGVGIWGSKKTAPAWTADELGPIFMRIMERSESSRALIARAKAVGAIARRPNGRHAAAKAIVDYAKGKNLTKTNHNRSAPHQEL